MRILRPFFLVCALSACTNTVRFTPTMEADPSSTGLEGLILLNELGEAYKIKPSTANRFCDITSPSFQERETYPYRRYSAKHKNTADIFRCWGYKEPSSGDVRNHILAGFALSDLYCDIFFRRIAAHANKRRFIRNGANDLGAAVSATLGLLTAGSVATGGAGVAFALFDSAFRNYDDSFLITSDLQSLQPKVKSEQNKYRVSAYQAIPDNYFEANSAIIQYASYCSFVGMKALLNEAVVKSTDSKTMAEAIRQFQVDAATTPERLEADIAIRKAELAEAKQAAEVRALAATQQIQPILNEEGDVDSGENVTPVPDPTPTPASIPQDER